MDTTRNRLVIWGGGHGDYAGNEVYALDLNTLTLSRLNNPSSAVRDGCTNGGTYSDGKPVSRHTYNHLAYLPNQDAMFAWGGSQYLCGYFGTDGWLFNFSNLSWTSTSRTNGPVAGYYGLAAVHDPNTGLVYMHDNYDLRSYNPSTNVWSKRSSASITGGPAAAVIDPVRKKYFMTVNGDGTTLRWYDISSPTAVVAPQSASTTGCAGFLGSEEMGMEYDPVQDRIVGWNGGNTVYLLNPDTLSCTTVSYSGGPAAPGQGTYGRFRYSPASNLFVVCNDINTDCSALRLTNGTPPAADTTPDAFGFTAQTGVATSTTATSNTLTPSGYNGAAPISITGGSYSINGGAFVTAAGSISPGQTVAVRQTASGTFGITTTATLTIGGVAGTFAVTTQAAPAPGGSPTSLLNLVSLAGGAQPFTVGLGFKKGDIAGTPALNITDSQVIVMRRWNDGSVKHAVASGQAVFAAGTPLAVSVSNVTAAPSGTNLTAANIQTANPQASISFGTYGTVSLSSLLGTPFRTFISGPEMVEAHYRAQAGSDPTLAAWFHVRLYKGGKVWIRAVGENGYLDVTTASKSYVPSVTIGGAQVWNNAGAALTHYAHTRWAQEGWIGGDPQITPRHDTSYLKASRLVPNYMPGTPSAAALDGLYQTYAPNQSGNWTPSMGETGFQAQIGLLPQWDALFVTSNADARAYKAVISNAKALNSYSIIWSDSVTKLPVKPSDRPTWSLGGPNQGGGGPAAAGSLQWEGAHFGSGGYLAYLLTGDYYYLETLEHQSALTYLEAGSVDWTTNPASNNFGTSRYFNGQTRSYAWKLRSLSQHVGIAPSGNAIAADYSALLANNMTHLKAFKDSVNPAGIGYLYEYDASLYAVGTVAPWQQHFFIQSLGMGSDLEPLSNMSAYNDVRDYMYRAAVGILGDSTGYCFTQASAYNIKTNDGTGNSASSWYQTWAQVYAASFASTPCGNTLTGNSGGDPASASSGYWGNLLPAIAYAVDHGAPGAAASWTRLTGASNWSTILNSGFNNTPQWGVTPRDTVTSPPATTVTLAASPVSITVGSPTTLSWSATNATACTASNGWTGAKATSGSQSVSPTINTTYALTCNGTNGSATQSVTVTVSAAVPAPVVTLSVSPATITAGASATLAWNSTNATSCTASGGWSGTQSTSGSTAVSPTATTSYVLTCTGAGGTAIQNATLTVTPATPTPVNGVCGSANGTTVSIAPVTNLCSAGTASAVTGSGPWSWTCGGSGGGSTATCNANISLATSALQVGPGKTYATIADAVAAAQPGSTIEIDAGIYSNETINLSKDNLTLRGVGGRAHVKWGTGDYLTNTATLPNGKGIFIVSGDNITLENLEFSGAKVVDENGAGIRYEGGNLTIRGSYFHHNENGILGEGGMTNTLLVENSIFEQNGYCLSSCAHNIYIGRMGTFIFRHNKSMNSKEGHTLKSRANITEVVGNYFSTKGSDGSYEANFPNGGTVYFVGNVVEQGINTGNATLLSYGEEGATNPNLALHVVNNTFNNLKGTGTFISASGAPAMTIKNNIFAGGGSIGVTADGSNKVLTSSAFVNSDAGDYHLAPGAAAIDAGVDPGAVGAYGLAPQWEYVEPAGKVGRVVSGSAIDVGAYEFSSASVPGDATPDALSFVAQSGVVPGAIVTSNTVTPTGYNLAATIAVTGGSYSINGGAFVTTAGTITPGQSVALRMTASSNYNTASAVTLSIGGTAGTFMVTTQSASVDTTPDAFAFTAQTGIVPGTVVTSGSITPSGYNAAAAISVTGGSFSVNGGAYVTGSSTISPGQNVAVRMTTSASDNTQTCATLTIGGVSGQFCATTGTSGSPPPGAETGLDFPSNDVTTSVRFRFSNPQNIGLPQYGPNGSGVTYVWKVFPRHQNGYYTTFFWGPDGPFTGASYYGAHPYPDGGGSNTTTHRWEISADGGDFVTDKNGNNTSLGYNQWYTQALRVWKDSNGQKRHEFYWSLPDTSKVITYTADATYGEVLPLNPALTFGDAPWSQSNEMLNGILRGLQIYNTSLSPQDILSELANPLSTAAGNANIWYLNLNPTPTDISDKSGRGHHPAWVGSARPTLYTGGTAPPPPGTDTIPDAFAFASQSGVAVNSVVTSNVVTPSGFNAATSISVSAGASYSINGGAFVTTAGTINPGQSVAMRLTASNANSTTTSATLTIGGVSGSFAVTTQAAAPDTTPNAFSFTAQTGVAPGTGVTSNTITPTGYNAAASISVSGGSYSINGGAFVTSAGTINPGQAVAVRLTASNANSTTTSATLTIGGVSGSFAVTTQAPAPDTTPNAFSFTAQTGVAPGAVATSNTITPTGYNAATVINVSGGSYSINGGAFVTSAGTISPGQSVTLRLTASNANSTTTSATLTIGGVSGSFAVSTQAAAPDTTPDAFGFASQTDVTPGSVVTSNPINPTGYNAAASISVSGGSYSINGGAFVSTAGTINPGQTVAVRLTASNASSTITSAALTIGGVTGAFAVTTQAQGTAPGAPANVTAKAGMNGVTVTFAAPASDGGSSITGYSATCVSSNGGTPGSNAGAAGAVSIQVSGLTKYKKYTCTVSADNAFGTGPQSTPSNAVRPFDMTAIMSILMMD